MKLKLTGEIPSHKNLWKRAKYGGMYMSKPEAFDNLLAQLIRQGEDMIKKDCYVEVTIRGDNRKDTNNQFQTICDLLEKAGMIKNDRLIKEFKVKKIVTKSDVGADIELSY